MDPLIIGPLAKVAWQTAKAFFWKDVEAKYGKLPQDIQDALVQVNDAAVEAAIAAKLLEHIKAAAEDEVRKARVEEIKKQRVAARKAAKKGKKS